MQDLRVIGASVAGDDVIVSVYGGSDNVCGTVRFTFADPGRRERTVCLVERWAATDELVTLVTSSGEVSLFSERASFERAAG